MIWEGTIEPTVSVYVHHAKVEHAIRHEVPHDGQANGSFNRFWIRDTLGLLPLRLAFHVRTPAGKRIPVGVCYCAAKGPLHRDLCHRSYSTTRPHSVHRHLSAAVSSSAMMSA